MSWTVHVHEAVATQLKAIPPDRRKRILDDIIALEEDPFRGLVKPLKGKQHKGKYRKVSGRYRIISRQLMFESTHATRTVEVLALLLRNENTYR
jgi:mRNA-degrading endonuclease RelE of RelBE toxin-antitoxin system